jgi:hypothetical protein
LIHVSVEEREREEWEERRSTFLFTGRFYIDKKVN